MTTEIIIVLVTASIALASALIAFAPEIEAWRADHYWNREMGRDSKPNRS